MELFCIHDACTAIGTVEVPVGVTAAGDLITEWVCGDHSPFGRAPAVVPAPQPILTPSGVA